LGKLAGIATTEIDGLSTMGPIRATRETVLLAASVAWCAVLACSLLYVVLMAAL
jgi:hypothetical protein